MKSPQTFTGRIAMLNQFVSKSIDKCSTFFQMLWKVHEWNDNCKEEFTWLNKYFINPHLLSQTVLGETLYLYMSITTIIVSTTLVGEEATPRYPLMKLLAFVLVIVAHRLRPYFQVHSIKILTEAPLRVQAPGKLIDQAEQV